MPRKQIVDMIEELQSWLPNYDHGPKDYPILLFRILASLPGGDELEDMGYETFNLGWHEMEQLARTLDAIQDKTDVEDLVQGLTHEEEEDLDEARRRSPKEEWWIHWHGSEPEGPFEKREYAEDWGAAERERGRGRYTIRRGDPEAREQQTREAARPAQLHSALRTRETPRRPAAKPRAKKAPAKKTTTRKKTPTRRRR